jgi:hypothetical protein
MPAKPKPDTTLLDKNNKGKADSKPKSPIASLSKAMGMPLPDLEAKAKIWKDLIERESKFEVQRDKLRKTQYNNETKQIREKAKAAKENCIKVQPIKII